MMSDTICFFNGEYIPESEVRLSPWDTYFTEGAVYDVGRTYKHVPFFWEEHIDRWFCSLRAVQIDIGMSRNEVHKISLEVFDRNRNHLRPEDDFLIIHRASRGVMPGFAIPPSSPTMLVHGTYMSLIYERLARFYKKGVHLVVVNTRQIPPQCLDPKIKHTNRFCNTLASIEAKMVDPDAIALMLDLNGFVAESPLNNFFMVRNGKLYTPTTKNCLQGVTRMTILDLAKEKEIDCIEKDLTMHELCNADEMFLTANSFTIYPVSKFNKIRVFQPIPGPVTKDLLDEFSSLVGVDIVQRALDYVRKDNG